MIQGRWYAAVGGLGLEIMRHDSGGRWRAVGYIEKNRCSWDIRVNPYQDHGYVLSSHSSLEKAKAAFLKRMSVTSVEPSETDVMRPGMATTPEQDAAERAIVEKARDSA